MWKTMELEQCGAWQKYLQRETSKGDKEEEWWRLESAENKKKRKTTKGYNSVCASPTQNYTPYLKRELIKLRGWLKHIWNALQHQGNEELFFFSHWGSLCFPTPNNGASFKEYLPKAVPGSHNLSTYNTFTGLLSEHGSTMELWEENSECLWKISKKSRVLWP